MKRTAEELLRALTPKRYEILKLLREEKHPDEIAKTLRISRQAADKHLSTLYRLGMVDKRIKEGNRPMVYYKSSEQAMELVCDLEELMESYINALRDEVSSQIKQLDENLVYGKITEGEYWRLRRRLEARFEWLR